MTQGLPPPLPDSLPDDPKFRKDSRYRRPRRAFSWWGLFIGLAIGISLGLYYTWVVDPVEEFDTAPRQLRAEDKSHYAVAVALEFSYDSDLRAAIDQLVALELGGDPLQSMADIACDLARSGYVNSNAGLRAVRSMKTFYQLQGRVGCADELIPDVSEPQVVEIEVPTPTPTLPPPPSKTPTPAGQVSTPTATSALVIPTAAPRQRYTGRFAATFCDVQLSGIIEVFVLAPNGDGVPGQQIRVRWDGGEDRFVSGLKPGRGPSYADFQMTEGINYIIDMPGAADSIQDTLSAIPCITEGGREALRSYRVVFQQGG